MGEMELGSCETENGRWLDDLERLTMVLVERQ